MAKKSITKAITEDRRREVARLMVMGYSVRDIAVAVADSGIVNPKTEEPFTHTTIHNDMLALREEWRKEARDAIDAHIGTLVRELRAVRSDIWHEVNMIKAQGRPIVNPKTKELVELRDVPVPPSYYNAIVRTIGVEARLLGAHDVDLRTLGEEEEDDSGEVVYLIEYTDGEKG